MRKFAQLSGDQNYVIYGRAAALADACLDLRPSPGYLALPFGFPVGAGLYGTTNVVPCVLVHAPGAMANGLKAVPLASQPMSQDFVAKAFGTTAPGWLDSVVAVLVSGAELQLGPGDPLGVGGLTGACGTDLTWPGQIGVPAFATAGHVAQAKGNAVYDGVGTAVGSVGFCSNPAGSGLTPVADFAVVDRGQGVAFHPRIPASANAGAGAAILVGPSQTNAVVAAFCVYFRLTAINANVGDVYLTANSVTAQSDSGSPALLNGNVIGHVLGAVPGMTSIIQCIDYQLKAAGTVYPGVSV